MLSIFVLPLPWLTKILVDEVFPNRDVTLLFFVLVLAFSFTIFNTILGGLRGLFVFNLGLKMRIDTLLNYLRHLVKMPFGFFDNHPTGEIYTRLNELPQALDESLNLIYTIFFNGFTLLIFPIVLFLINWKLCLVAVITIPIDVVLYKYFNRIVKRYQQKVAEQNATVSAWTYETLKGIKSVQSLGIEQKMSERVSAENYCLQRVRSEQTFVKELFRFLISSIRALGTLIYSYVGWRFVISGNMTIGTFLAFSSYISYLYNPLREFVNVSMQIQILLVYIERYFEFYNQYPSILGHTATHEPHRVVGSITCKNLSFGYLKDYLVLEGFNMKVKAGEITALVGRSGSGKTTVCNLITRFAEPQKGQILLDGVDLKNFKPNSLRRHIGYAMQDAVLFTGTIKENITCFRDDIRTEDIERAVYAVNLEVLVNSLPDSLDTVIGEGGVQLSYGEKQRLCLARVLLKNTNILVMDEAMSALDADTAAKIMMRIADLIKGKTTIIASHKPAVLKTANAVYILENGEITERITDNQLADSLDGISHRVSYEQPCHKAN